MKKIIGPLTMTCLCYFNAVHAENSQVLDGMVAGKDAPYERHHYKQECKNFSEETKRFSDKLSDANLKIFCGEFNDTQREQAMQMARQKDANGKLMMTPDQSVEMIYVNKK